MSNTHTIRRLALGAATVGALIIPTGCGTEEIDHTKAENLIRTGLARAGELKNLKSVSCPSGIKAKKGGTFQCQVSAKNGSKGTYTLTQLNDSGLVKITSFTPGG